MLQVHNETPWVPHFFIFPDERGVGTLYVVLKATFKVSGGEVQVAEQQQPLVLVDAYWGEPGASSLKYASEAHLLKPGTDVVLLGEAHAPGGRPVSSCQVGVSVGPLRRVLQVWGDREWTGGLLSPRASKPEPFVRMPLTYERAYGGTHAPEGEPPLAEPRNPVGRGFRGKRSASDMVGLPLPNVEDPAALIDSIGDAPAPAGVGYVAPAWLPRKAHAGTYDERWRQRRAPYLPLDFKPDYFRAASAGLSSERPLQGGEPVELLNVSAAGVERFRLPRCELEVAVRMAGQVLRPALSLETVLLEPGQGRLCMTWRGAVPCDKKALKVERMDFRMKALEGVRGGG